MRAGLLEKEVGYLIIQMQSWPSIGVPLVSVPVTLNCTGSPFTAAVTTAGTAATSCLLKWRTRCGYPSGALTSQVSYHGE